MTPPAPTPEQPKHRADVPVDSCEGWPHEACDICLNRPANGRHAAARVAEDERRAP